MKPGTWNGRFAGAAASGISQLMPGEILFVEFFFRDTGRGRKYSYVNGSLSRGRLSEPMFEFWHGA